MCEHSSFLQTACSASEDVDFVTETRAKVLLINIVPNLNYYSREKSVVVVIPLQITGPVIRKYASFPSLPSNEFTPKKYQVRINYTVGRETSALHKSCHFL